MVDGTLPEWSRPRIAWVFRVNQGAKTCFLIFYHFYYFMLIHNQIYYIFNLKF